MGFKCIKMDQPSMVCNAEDVPEPKYEMENTMEVAEGIPVASLISNIRDVAKGFPAKPPRKVGGELIQDPPMNNLILNGHGGPGAIKIGEWINWSHAKEFGRLKGLVGWIWIVSCRTGGREPADDYDPWDVIHRPYIRARVLLGRVTGKPYPTAAGNPGDQFCRELARASGAYVIASPQFQSPEWHRLPRYMIDGYEGNVYCYFPNGTKDRIKHL